MKSFIRRALATFLCIVGLALCLWGVNYAFVGIYNTNNNYLSLAARNYLRFGFINLKSFPTYFAGEHFTQGTPYYLHHPIVVFWMEAAALSIFGFHNWTVHVPHLFFVIGTIIMVHLIAKSLWNKNVALWSAGLVTIFPMTTFFWKYMLFEQASLFLNLVTYYNILLYIRKQRSTTLWVIFIFTFMSGLVDWGVLYLFFPFLLFFFTRFRKVITKPFVVYIAGTIISLGIFGISVYLIQNGFAELVSAIWIRSYTAEITSLSVWPIRLLLITILRILLYFTPLSLAAFWFAYKSIRKKRNLPELTLLFFFIFGCLNLFFLPATAWGHSYFLYYFIPFFAFASALFIEKIEKRTWVLVLLVILVVFLSIVVNYFKLQQVKKQLWKYDVAADINKTLAPYEIIGVVNFSGDVFENYFLHPSQPITYSQITDWLSGKVFQGVTKAVFVCAGTCTSDELQTGERLTKNNLAIEYEVNGNVAWFITKNADTSEDTVPITEIIKTTNEAQIKEGSIFLRMYRLLRDMLKVGQI